MKMENTEGCGNLLKAIERGKRNFKIKKKGKMRGERHHARKVQREKAGNEKFGVWDECLKQKKDRLEGKRRGNVL